MLDRLLSQLAENNLLAAPSKVKILIQDKDTKYLGVQLKGGQASIPQQSVDIIKNLPAPRTIKECQRILGIINFFSCLIVHVRIYTFFLSKKLRKSEKFTWTEEDAQHFVDLKDAIAAATMPAFLRLTTPNLLHDCDVILYSDWSKNENSSSGICLLRYVENGKRVVMPAVCSSHVLPDTFQNHGSVLGELASFSQVLVKLERYIGNLPIVAYTDSIALVFLVQRRFSSNTALVQRLLLSIVSFHFVLRFLPGKLMNAAADQISRIKHERGKSINELLENTTDISDYDYVHMLLKPHAERETKKEWLDRQALNLELVERLERSGGLTYGQLVELFATTNVLPERKPEPINLISEEEEQLSRQETIMTLLQQSEKQTNAAEQQPLHSEATEEAPTSLQEPNVNTVAAKKDEVATRPKCQTAEKDAKGLEKTESMTKAERREQSIKKFQSLVKTVEAVESDFEGGDVGRDEEEGRVPADRQETKEVGCKHDLFDHIFIPCDTSALTEMGQRIYRQDSNFISKHPVLSISLTDPEEMIPEGVSNSHDLLDFLAERRFVAEQVNFLEEIQEPLFDNFDDVKKHLNLAQLNVIIASPKRYGCVPTETVFTILFHEKWLQLIIVNWQRIF